MKAKLLKGAICGVFLLIFCLSANAQSTSMTEKAFALTGKITVIVVGQTAKITYKTAKVAAKEIVLPIAKVTLKTIFLKVAPKVSMFLLKETGKAAEKSIPIGIKLFEKYVKYRLSL